MKTLSNSIRKGFTLIELLVVIGILAILLAITLIAINPSRQFKQANDTKRASDVNAILNAVGQYAAEVANKGQLPVGIPVAPTAAAEISKTGADLCASLVPTYIQALPKDPSVTGDPVDAAACAASYATGYFIQQSSTGRVTVSTTSELTGQPISVTR